MFVIITFEQGRRLENRPNKSRRGVWVIDPSPAVVTIGTNIQWMVRAYETGARRLRWIIEFKNRSPFKISRFELISDLSQSSSADHYSADHYSSGLPKNLCKPGLQDLLDVDHIAVSEPVRANEPGDYKYDLRVEDAADGSSLAEEDPWFHVVRATFVSA